MASASNVLGVYRVHPLVVVLLVPEGKSIACHSVMDFLVYSLQRERPIPLAATMSESALWTPKRCPLPLRSL